MGYTEFYRLWNVPVHDFTTFYIYGMLKPVRPLSNNAIFHFVFVFCLVLCDYFIMPHLFQPLCVNIFGVSIHPK